MSYIQGARTYQIRGLGQDLPGMLPGTTEAAVEAVQGTRWWDPSTWFDPYEATDFTKDTENLNNQFVLLERRANQTLPPDELAAFKTVIDAWARFWEEEVKTGGSGWYLISDDRAKFEQFDRVYRAWYRRVDKVDPNLRSEVAPPEVSLGPEDKGLLETASDAFSKTTDTLNDQFQAFVQSKYALPVTVGVVSLLGIVWLTSRSGARSGSRSSRVEWIPRLRDDV